MRRQEQQEGFTLIEFVLATLTLVVAATAILGAYVGQVTLNEHARNLSLAIQDASRVIEQIRVLNTVTGACPPFPTAVPPGFTSWDLWFAAQPGGRSLQNQFERIVVTCDNNVGATPPRCFTAGAGQQVGTGETTLHQGAGASGFDPIRVTVAVCWRHRNRNIGECPWNPVTNSFDIPTAANDTNPADGVISSPAMLTTIVTCRSQ